ncbi:MAG: ACT domain-containing protein [Verrucomicrobia bacterium]|nr:ACT domain-containing protein [Verrucomicrobiota bacterium]
MIKKQFTLYLENKPGALSKVTRQLGRAKVNIEGISVAESTDVSLVQIVASNAATTRRILKQLSIPFTVQDVTLLPLENVPGALCSVVSELARRKVNINYVYATGSAGKSPAVDYVVIGAPDLDKVEACWEQVCSRHRK